MNRTQVVIVGAGQAGLAMSRCLVVRGIDHVVIERGRVAERWRTASWDSLRLLTPNWMTRLPGYRYRGSDADGFMTKDELIGLLDGYASSFAAPIESETSVVSLEAAGDDYRVVTDRGNWAARAVVIATGQCESPLVPDMASALSPDHNQMTAADYRRPDGLAAGGVLVVGASASGLQIAQELNRAGRHVTLAVGRHAWLPRTYRGHDIMTWMDRIGILDDRASDLGNIGRLRAQPSLQLIGRKNGQLNLLTLQRAGVRVLGRVTAVQGRTIGFAGDLEATTSEARRKLKRLLDRINGAICSLGSPCDRQPPIEAPVMRSRSTILDLVADDIRTVIWATGYAPRYPWLKLPILDTRGQLLHRGGVTPSPGVYVLGLRWLRRRKSSFIDGVGPDAEELAREIVRYLGERARLAA